MRTLAQIYYDSDDDMGNNVPSMTTKPQSGMVNDKAALQQLYLNCTYGFPAIPWPFKPEEADEYDDNEFVIDEEFNEKMSERGIALGNKYYPMDDGTWTTISPDSALYQEIVARVKPHDQGGPYGAWVKFMNDPFISSKFLNSKDLIEKATALIK